MKKRKLRSEAEPEGAGVDTEQRLLRADAKILLMD
jgi:hypothetical protein